MSASSYEMKVTVGLPGKVSEKQRKSDDWERYLLITRYEVYYSVVGGLSSLG